MATPLTQPAEEIKRLQRCINDLVSVLALPAIWAGGDQPQVVETLLDALMGMLALDLVYVRLNDFVGAPFEMARVGHALSSTASEQDINRLLDQWLGDEPKQSPHPARTSIEGIDIALISLRLGLQGEIGMLVAGSQRPDFPRQTEGLVLSVTTNQAAIGLREARLLSDQKRLAGELDRRVAERTKELAEAENNFRQIVDSIPGLVCTMNPAGAIQLLNRPLLDYFGKSPDELKGWAMTDAVHPEDLPRVVAAFTYSMTTGTPYDIEHRCRRADGVYRWFQVRALPVHDTAGAITGWYVLLIDIDDRKRTEEALRASERTLSQIVNTIPTTAWSTRPDGFCDYLSQRWLDYAGMTPEQAQGWGWGDAIHPGDANALVEYWQSCLASGIPVDAEARIRRFDGEYRWFLIRANPLRDESGNVIRWYGTTIDIEDRKRADDELRGSEARKTAILDSALDCIITMDHDGQITEFNPAAERTFGHRRNEVVGKKLAEVIIPPALREQHRQGLARYIASGEQRVLGTRLEMTAIRADGSEFPVELAISRIRLDGPPAFTGYLRDITERKEAEEELRRSEAFLAQGQRLNLTGSFSWRVDTDEIRFSDQLYRIFEFDQDQPVTFEQIVTRIHPEDIPLLSQKIALARKDIIDHDYELRLRMPDSSIKYLRSKSCGIRDRDGRIEHIGAIQDVTEQRLSDQALGKLRSELAHMARVTSLGALTASVAHEVNQPLSGIVTNASTCLRMLTAAPPNVEGALETARRTIRDGKRASEVIARLRALFSKKDAIIEAVDLNEAIRDVIALSLSDLQRNHIILRTELADDFPLVTGDRIQLQQVILNLLRNASDAMGDVEDRPRLLVIRTERDGDDHVRVTVRDSGLGLDPRDLDRLFDAFYTTKSAGMGIGLSVSRSIIESHHGRLWAVPNDGPGATFFFSIPRAPEGAAGTNSPNNIQTSALLNTLHDMRNP